MSSGTNAKRSPCKRQKVGGEDEENVDLTKEEEKSLPDEKSAEDGDGTDTGEALTRKKVPDKIRAEDIFHVTPLGTNHRPGQGDFVAGTFPKENDLETIARRRKQIDFGKATTEYSEYSKAIPREERQPSHPRTPNIQRKYSRRAWDGLIRVWRLKLHFWDRSPEEVAKALQGKNTNESFSSAGESASTTSSVMDEQDPEVSFLSEAEEVEQTLVEEPKGKDQMEPLRTSSPVVVEPYKESSWYEETLEFEAEYPDLYAKAGDDFNLDFNKATKG